jgi:hypothetical protein
MSSLPKLRLDWCSYQAAKYACEKWHYSGCVPKSKQVWIGAWESERFIGIVSFGRSTTPYLGTAYGLDTIECAELTRIALAPHKNPVSRIMAVAIRMIRKQSPGLRLLVSLADPLQGHVGSVYQATNWIYVGRSSACTQYLVNGKWRNDTPIGRMLKSNPSLKKVLPSRQVEGKHKYLMPLDEVTRAMIQRLSRPYPERAGSAASGTPDLQSGRGGATPTPALHTRPEPRQPHANG